MVEGVDIVSTLRVLRKLEDNHWFSSIYTLGFRVLLGGKYGRIEWVTAIASRKSPGCP